MEHGFVGWILVLLPLSSKLCWDVLGEARRSGRPSG